MRLSSRNEIAMGRKSMQNVKITVLKTLINEELIAEYGAPNLTACPFHKPGDVFICQDGSQPQGLCGEAWHAIGKYAFAFASGGDGFWPGWIEKRNVAINSCNDGLRPVFFKIEPMEE
jgi:uncharacterized repeat protein (TIGR04076 family)